MKDSQILSAFSDLSAPPAAPRRALVFDACHVGVILRAVLFVEAVMSVGAMFGAASARDWLLRLSVLSAAALPATLAWLIVGCSLKQLLARLPPAAQQAFGMTLGAFAGVYGCALLAWVGFVGTVPWVASAFAGAAIAAALVAALVLRAKGRMPADTAARLSELQLSLGYRDRALLLGPGRGGLPPFRETRRGHVGRGNWSSDARAVVVASCRGLASGDRRLCRTGFSGPAHRQRHSAPGVPQLGSAVRAGHRR